LYLRTRAGSSANNAIIMAYNTSTMVMNANSLTYAGEEQFSRFGEVASAGTGNRLPSGWSSSKLATGQYRVTHNLGTTGYTVTVGGYGASSIWPKLAVKSGNYFDVYAYNNSAGAADTAFTFDLRVY
jgi:hypothetical protein